MRLRGQATVTDGVRTLLLYFLQGVYNFQKGQLALCLAIVGAGVFAMQAFGVQLDARRDGALPDGTPISVFSHGGGYDVPRAHVVVDENGDGEVDIENWLVSFAVAEGIVEAHGQRWRFTPSPDGSTLSLEPTDEAEFEGLMNSTGYKEYVAEREEA